METYRPVELRWPLAVSVAAAILIATRAVSLDHALAEVSRLAPVVGFLAAVLVLAKLCDDEGLFRAAGAAMARLSSGQPRKLFAAVFAVAATTTAVLSLDATVVLLTPVVLATAGTLGISPRPHAYAAAHLANSASLLLPVSNLTNLLAFSAAGLSFGHFTALMALPWLLAVALEYLLLRWYFRRDLTVVTPADPAPPPQDRVPVFVLVVLAVTLAGFAVASLLGVSPAWSALGGVVVLGVHALVRRRTTMARIVAAADIGFLVFVLGLGVVVAAAAQHGLATAVRAVLPAGTSLLALLGIAAVAALLSNVVNNLPAVLVLLPLVAGAGAAAALAVLVGVNVGPNLTYQGSLSNMLWHNIIDRGAMSAGYLEFSRVGLFTVPLTLVVPMLGLWLSLQVFGT
jgi:arsenical pump membrane protein